MRRPLNHFPLSGRRGHPGELPAERVRDQHPLDDRQRAEAPRPAAGVPVGLRVHRQDHPVHVSRRHHVLHALPGQDRAGGDLEDGEGQVPQGQVPRHLKGKIYFIGERSRQYFEHVIA